MKFHGPKQIKIRIRKNYTKDKFLWELDRESWIFPDPHGKSKYEKINILEESVSKFNKNITTALNRVAPMKIVNIKSTEEPWKNNEEVKNIVEKERKLWLRWKDEPNNSERQNEWNKANQLLKKPFGAQKSKFIKESIDESLGNKSKYLWKGVKDALNWRSGGAPGELRDKNGAIEYKPQKLTEIYHDKLEDKVFSIMSELEDYSETPDEEKAALELMYGEKQEEPQFEFSTIRKEYLIDVINNLPRKSSHGYDEISYIDIKDSIYYSIDPLLQIINLVIETGHWPNIEVYIFHFPIRECMENYS